MADAAALQLRVTQLETQLATERAKASCGGVSLASQPLTLAPQADAALVNAEQASASLERRYSALASEHASVRSRPPAPLRRQP